MGWARAAEVDALDYWKLVVFICASCIPLVSRHNTIRSPTSRRPSNDAASRVVFRGAQPRCPRRDSRTVDPQWQR